MMVGIYFFVRYLFFVSLGATANDPMAAVPITYQCSQCRDLVERGFGYPGYEIRFIDSVNSYSG